MVISGVNTMSRDSGIHLRTQRSILTRHHAPSTTASTPPRPARRMESSGTASLKRPRMEEILLMPSRPVIMPSIPPRMGVPPNFSAAR